MRHRSGTQQRADRLRRSLRGTVQQGGRFIVRQLLRGAGADSLIAVALGPSNEVYLLGTKSSADFPLPLANGIASGNQKETFLVQLRPDGSVGFAQALPLLNGVTPVALSVAANSIYIAGTAFAGSLGTTAGAFQVEAAAPAQFDAFVTRWNATADTILYSTYLGGSAQEVVTGLAVDNAGNAYVAGTTRSSDYPVTPGAWKQVAPATPLQSNAFIAVLNPTGSELVASARFGG